jgi:hypothetical protein
VDTVNISLHITWPQVAVIVLVYPFVYGFANAVREEITTRWRERRWRKVKPPAGKP